jgi:hypothetical protein
MMKPASSPARRPKASAAATPKAGGTPREISVAQVMPATPITEPTDRSIPPVSSTNVSPTAQMPMIDTCRSTLRRFAPVRKTSLLAVKTSTRISRAR